MTCNQLASCGSTVYDDASSLTDLPLGIAPRVKGAVPESVRREIRRQAAYSAPSQLGGVIAVTLANSRVDWRNVSLDDMKRLVVEAVVASRGQVA